MPPPSSLPRLSPPPNKQFVSHTHQLCHRAVGQPGKRLGVLAYAVKALGVDRAAVPPLRRGEAHALLWAAATPQRLHNAALGAALLRDAVALAGDAARVAAGKLGVAAAVVGLALGGVHLVGRTADARAGAVYRAAVALVMWLVVGFMVRCIVDKRRSDNS